jgi:hypothetical protein
MLVKQQPQPSGKATLRASVAVALWIAAATPPGHAYYNPIHQYIENGVVRTDFGAQRVLVDQTADRGCFDILPWRGGGTVHVAWNPHDLRPTVGNLVVERRLEYGGLYQTCDTPLGDECVTTLNLPVSARNGGSHTLRTKDGYDPFTPDPTHGTCLLGFRKEEDPNMPIRLQAPEDEMTGTACVVWPAGWTHPVSFPRSAQDPLATVGVVIGPQGAEGTKLRSGGGFSGAVRLIVYDPDDATRRRYFWGEQLTLSASWDGRLFHYSPAQGDAIPQQTADPPAYVASSRYGMMVEVFTQDEVLTAQSTTTAYPNPRFTFDYHALPNDPTGTVNLTVYTPLD